MTANQLLQLQRENGASNRLVAHHKIVAKVAKEVSKKFSELGMEIDEARVEAMAVTHDIGKIKVPSELSKVGKKHEKVGYDFAQELSIPEQLAKICILHGSKNYTSLDVEVLAVILADKLWKGKRVEVLETHVCQIVSEQTRADYWSTFLELDSLFEAIAEKGHERLISVSTLD